MSAQIIKIRTHPQEPIRIMDRPVYRPSSLPRLIATLTLSIALWCLLIFVIFRFL